MSNNTKRQTDQIEQKQTPLVHSEPKSPTQYIVLSEQCLREIAEHERLLELYSVHCFAIIRAGTDKTNSYQIISPWLVIQQQAQAILAQSKAQYPGSYIARYKSYFTSEYEEGRQELLARLDFSVGGPNEFLL